MYINNPVTAAGVWTYSARTLTADPATDAGAATLVWARAIRTLTLLTNLISFASVPTTSLANNATFDLRASLASRCREVTISVNDGRLIAYFDGTLQALANNYGAGIPIAQFFGGVNGNIGPRLNNTTGAAVGYMYTYIEWLAA